MARWVVRIAAGLAVVALAACSGGGSGGGTVPPPPAGTGTLRGNLGAPGAGATVRLEGTAQSTLADANGEFTFTAVSPGKFTLSVATGGGLGAAAVVTIAPGTVTVVPPLPLGLGGQIVGLVTAYDSAGNSAPVAGARVTARPQPMLWDYPGQVDPNVVEGVEAAGGAPSRQRPDDLPPIRIATTDAEGSFRFSAVAPGAYIIEVTAEGCESGETGTWVEPGRTGTADVALERIDPDNASVSGRVSNEAGEPLAWVQAMLWPADASRPLPASPGAESIDPLYLPPFVSGKAVYTDEQGRYYLRNVVPGRYTLSFWVYGYEPVTREIVLLARETRIEDVSLRSNLTTVSGTVYRSLNGVLVPVAGAMVSASAAWMPMASESGTGGGGSGWIAPRIDPATDDQGRFSRQVSIGSVGLYAWEPSYGSAWREVEVGSGGLSGVELVLEPDTGPEPAPLPGVVMPSGPLGR